MFKVGEKYKIYRSGAIELKDKKWVKAVVEHIPEHDLENVLAISNHSR